jgi:hypothetical protein
MKPDSLSNEGMKPCVKSIKHFQEKRVGWHRDCSNISYKLNNILRNRDRKPDKELTGIPNWYYYYFTLSFTYTLLYNDDTVFFAHAVPYTYNFNLLPFLNSIARNQEFIPEEEGCCKYADYSEFLRIGTLCKSLTGNHMKMVVITENVKTYPNFNDDVKW